MNTTRSSQPVSPNALLRAKNGSRLSAVNLLLIAGVIVFGSILVVFAIGMFMHGNGNPSTDIVQGGPAVTGSTNASDLNGDGPSYGAWSDHSQRGRAGNDNGGDDSGNGANTTKITVTPKATPQPTATPVASTTSTTSGGGGGGGSSDDRGAAIREEHRRVIAQAQARAREDQARVDAQMHSFGTIPLPQSAGVGGSAESGTVDGSGTAAGDVAQIGGAPTSLEQRQFAAPLGPILALDTHIPVEVRQVLDSTFGGQVAVRVTKDVKDETETSVIIPINSKCFITSTAGGVDGQQRVYATGTLCKLPNRDRLVLDNYPAVDIDGATGLKARVDDHGAGRRGRSSGLLNVPGMLGGFIPGVGMASSIASMAGSSQVGHAMSGPTLYVDASPDKPRQFFLNVPHDTPVRAYVAPPSPSPATATSYTQSNGDVHE